MRAWLSLIALLSAGCAGTPAPAQLDIDAHARVTLAGFREASPWVSERLAVSAGWAVFPDVEDAREACAHEGMFFERDGDAHPALLRCAARPTAPAGAAYHLLVLLEEEADLALLFGGESLDLEHAAHFTTSDVEEPEPAATKRWVVTSERGGLLFGAWSARQSLELAAGS